MKCRSIANALRLWSPVRSKAPSSRYNFKPSLETLTDRVVPASGIICGHVYQDATGNGLSADDCALAGVTVKLVRDSNHDGVLNDGNSVVAVRKSGTNGCYRFDNLPADRYFVVERVPATYVRTAPVLDSHYTVNLDDGQRAGGRHFDNYRKPCVHAVSSFNFTVISPDGTQTTVNNLRGHTQAGDTIIANFTVAPNSRPVVVTLVSYNAPGSTFDANTANQQTIFEIATGSFGAGEHSLTVHLPDNSYQVDFVVGKAINHFGPAGSNIFYTPQCRLLSADNGGASSPAQSNASLSGRVFIDVNQDGVMDASAGDTALPLVQVNLYSVDADGNRTFVATTSTAADGRYSFTNLAAGIYVLSETQPNGHDDGHDFLGSLGGWQNEFPNDGDELANIVIAAGQQGSDYNFTELAGAASLSGNVGMHDENSASGVSAMANVIVTLQYVDAQGVTITLTTQTDGDGLFTFSGLANATYTLTEMVPDGFSPIEPTVGTVNGAVDGEILDNHTITNIAIGEFDSGTGYMFQNLMI